MSIALQNAPFIHTWTLAAEARVAFIANFAFSFALRWNRCHLEANEIRNLEGKLNNVTSRAICECLLEWLVDAVAIAIGDLVDVVIKGFVDVWLCVKFFACKDFTIFQSAVVDAPVGASGFVILISPSNVGPRCFCTWTFSSCFGFRIVWFAIVLSLDAGTFKSACPF